MRRAQERLGEVGPNELEASEGIHPLRLLARQVNNTLIYLLVGAAIVSVATGHWVDAGVIVGVIVLNSLLGFLQEWRAEGALAALRRMSAPHTRVLRDGRVQQVEASEVVPGDVLVMETGDRVGADARVLSSDDLHVDESALSGRDVQKLDKPTLAEQALEVGVFARVSPADKLKIMESLKEKGHIVAMTGDGVNDAPALKGADIGVAMGRAGTEVAKEAADMVLTDDNFATIVHAIEEGRVIYNNLRRVIFFLLSTNLGEVLTLIGALILGLDLPLTAVMILWVNLITDGACTIPLGIEPRHRDVLRQPPRNPSSRILDRTMLRRMAILTLIMALGTLALFYYEIRAGTFPHAQSIAFATMAAFQWFQAFNTRSQCQSIFSVGLFTNRWLLVGIGTAVVLQVAAIHTSVGQWLFGTTPLSWFDWLLIVLVSSSIWIVDELLKRLGVHGVARPGAVGSL